MGFFGYQEVFDSYRTLSPKGHVNVWVSLVLKLTHEQWQSSHNVRQPTTPAANDYEDGMSMPSLAMFSFALGGNR